MGRAVVFPPEKLIIPVLYPDDASLVQLKRLLTARFGPVDYQSAGIPFIWSSYYEAEMGGALYRTFLAFERLVQPETLWRIKRITNRIENRLALHGKRRVNLDPGLLDLNRLVLATTKHAGHRIPLAKGIYAEITLHYRKGAYQPFAWTYPDYRTDAYQAILLELRKIFHNQLKHRS